MANIKMYTCSLFWVRISESMQEIVVTFKLGKQITPFKQNFTYPVLCMLCAEQLQSFFFFSPFFFILIFPPGLVCLIVEAPHQENVEDWSIFLSPQITTFLALISVFRTQWWRWVDEGERSKWPRLANGNASPRE